MHRRRFSQLSLCADETGAGAFICATSIFCATHLLSISHRSETAASESGPRSATAQNGEEAAAGPYAATSGRASDGAHARAEEPICAVMDAPARCRDHGIVLQQRIETERTRCA